MAEDYNCSDIELADRLRSGDSAAFTAIYHRYWECLYRSAFQVLRDSDVCDDLIQEIFIWLWSNREKHTISAFEPYLRAAVKYKVANIIRHGKVKEAFFTYALQQETQQELLESDDLEIRELKAIIRHFCENLPDRAQKIFYMSRYEYRTNKEIAEELGISEKTVENQMNINLKKLRISLGRMSFWSILL